MQYGCLPHRRLPIAVSEAFLNRATSIAIVPQGRDEPMSERLAGGRRVKLCISNHTPPHGREGSLDARMHERRCAWGRRGRRTLGRQSRQRSRVPHSPWMAVCPGTSWQTCSTRRRSHASRAMARRRRRAKVVGNPSACMAHRIALLAYLQVISKYGRLALNLAYEPT